MSYEGTNHKLCANGHYSAVDAMSEMYIEDLTTCPYCPAPITHEFAQDYTNGSNLEEPRTMLPDMQPWQIAPVKGATCNLGHFHVSEAPRYKVPDNGLWRNVTR